MIKTSLIVSTYNWPQALELCLKSILAQVVLPAEVIIADDGSEPATKVLIEQYKNKFPIPVSHIWHEDKGFRKTVILNKAIRTTSSDYIIQIDGDVILDKHFIYDHIKSAENNAFVRGTRAMLTQDKTASLLKNKNIHLSPFDKGVKNWNNAIRLPLLKWFGSKKEMSAKRVRGSNLSYFKKDYIKINGYNNNLTGWGHEDEELAARFINNNIIKKIVKLAAVQYHLHHSIASAENEPAHAQEVKNVLAKKIKVCRHGYNNLSYV